MNKNHSMHKWHLSSINRNIHKIKVNKNNWMQKNQFENQNKTINFR